MKEIERLFQELPKPANLHVHFSTFVPYDIILNDIQNHKKIRDQLWVNSDMGLSFYKEFKHKTYHPLTDLDIEKIRDILKIKNKMKTFVMLGGIFYGVIKNFHYYQHFYLKHILTQMKKQHIGYIEFRLHLGSCVDYQGNKISIQDELEALYPYHTHFQIIVQENKSKGKKAFDYFQSIQDIIHDTKYEKIIRGYDLVGHEGIKTGFKDMYHQLQDFKQKNHIHYYLHAGEIPKNKKAIENLKYAIQLEPIRIGHGINIFDYPELWNDVKKKNIFLENCPISNVVFFRYQLNIQNIIQNINHIVIGSDDDNKFGTNLSMDYYYLYYLGLDMKYIYQLLLNSGKFVPNFDKKKFDHQFLIFYKKYEKLVKK